MSSLIEFMIREEYSHDNIMKICKFVCYGCARINRCVCRINECPICSWVYYSKYNLTRHINTTIKHKNNFIRYISLRYRDKFIKIRDIEIIIDVGCDLSNLLLFISQKTIKHINLLENHKK